MLARSIVGLSPRVKVTESQADDCKRRASNNATGRLICEICVNLRINRWFEIQIGSSTDYADYTDMKPEPTLDADPAYNRRCTPTDLHAPRLSF